MNLDEALIRIQKGDEVAFEQIYRQTEQAVFYIALSVVRDRALAEDVMQTTYLNVLRHASSYRRGTNARAWIFRIARNEALNLKKKRSREESIDVNEHLPAFGIVQTDDYGLLTESAQKVLTEEEFTLLMLIAVQGYKRREIASMTGLPIGTVTWKYNRALAKLKRELKGKEGM